MHHSKIPPQFTLRRLLSVVTLCAAPFAIFLSTASWAESRTWKDAGGTFEIEAEFVAYTDGDVKLKKTNGGTVTVPLKRLSDADRRFVRKELRSRRTRTKAGARTVLVSNAAVPGEWGQWRGPNGDGISTETGLLASWDTPPPIAWQTKGLGGGYASVAIAGGKIFTLGKRKREAELIALDAKDGRELWSTPVGEGNPNSTPTVDGNLVYALGRDGDLVCADMATGREVWRKKFSRDFGGKMMSGWGYSESPLVDGDVLVCTPGGSDALLVALDKKTGREIWRTRAAQPLGSRGRDGAGYSSIAISNAGGVKQYVQLAGRGLVGVAAKDGRLLWNYNRIANGTANIPTPVVSGDYVFTSSGYGTGAALLKLKKNRGGIAVEEVYFLTAKQMQNHHGGMLLIGEHLYCGHGHNNGFPLCIDFKTGRDAWRPGRGAGSGSAAILAADGHLYLRYQSGVMALVEATPKSYKLKGTFKIASNHGKSWPHPVIADRKLYLRDQHELHCYDIAAR